MGGRVGGGMGGKTKGFIKTKSLGWEVCEDKGGVQGPLLMK